jgi:hypothetical protein
MLPGEQSSPEQITDRGGTLAAAEALYRSARKFKAAAVRTQHPDPTNEQIDTEVRRIFLHART